MAASQTENLFIYGTLGIDDIQLKLFGRLVRQEADTLSEYIKKEIRLPDIPGGTFYPILEFTGDPEDLIEGYVLRITVEELFTADAYEGTSYKRIKVVLHSGLHAWCYTGH